MVGQLASSIQTFAMTVEKGKFPSQSVPDPKGVHEESTTSSQHREEVKAVMTLRKGKEFDNKVEMPRLAKVKKESTTSEIMEIFKQFHYGKYREFIQAVIDLGEALAERKIHLVYGGGDRGLSRLASEATFTRESQVLGIIPKALKVLSNSPIGEVLVVSGDHATLEALITFTSWAYLNIHKKLIVSMKQLFICAPIANKLLDLLEECRRELDLKTLTLDWSTDDGSSSSKMHKFDLTLHL
ncbi:hypothetical protein WN944_001178 [Citrus x changshan-huyou]|uniref:Uncharacterized protein n=1 Tax=Citrus x changshan-huyou TaxID=2935761 RepID=A0AAP0MIR3_9ROSI